MKHFSFVFVKELWLKIVTESYWSIQSSSEELLDESGRLDLGWRYCWKLGPGFTSWNKSTQRIISLNYQSSIPLLKQNFHFYISNRELWNHTYDHCRQSMFSCWCLFCFPPLGFLVGVWSLVLECHPPLVLKVIQTSGFDIYWCIDLNKNDTDNFLWYWLFCS